jgi:hypothetical protein
MYPASFYNSILRLTAMPPAPLSADAKRGGRKVASLGFPLFASAERGIKGGEFVGRNGNNWGRIRESTKGIKGVLMDFRLVYAYYEKVAIFDLLKC